MYTTIIEIMFTNYLFYLLYILASVHSLAAPVGSFASGPIMDYIGRRPTLMLSVLPLVLGWSLISMASNHATLLIGRMMAGMSVGLVAAPAQVQLFFQNTLNSFNHQFQINHNKCRKISNQKTMTMYFSSNKQYNNSLSVCVCTVLNKL